MTKEIKKGKLLMAQPFSMDPHFKRSTVLLCDHNADGTVGFVLNRPLHMNISQLIADFPEIESDVYYGGPVATDTIHYLHSAKDLLENSSLVVPGVYWGGDYDKLKVLISTKLIMPKDIRFFVGYSGWSKGQLAEEMHYGSWISTDMHANYLFKSKSNQLWKQAMHNKGKNYSVVSQMPDPICLN